MKKFKGLILLILMMFSPLNVLAYSDYIIPGGSNIGIEIKTDGILIVGFYKVTGKFNQSNPVLKVGDRITKVGNKEVNTIKELINNIETEIIDNKVFLSINRDGKELESTLTINKENNIYKTGLYVKDTITGTGTLSYIDPGTKIYGALGHEIIEGNSKEKVEIKSGSIYKSNVTGVEKSSSGKPGEKNAKLDYKSILGTINKNTTKGIFGTYSTIERNDLLKVAKPDEIKTGDAVIRTVIKDTNIEEFTINIKKLNNNTQGKNIYFEVTDKDLVSKTGGIIQGMSGSPIIQNNMIIGVVTHVIIDKPSSGYGIFITTMLEQGES